jgi:hypothetical protein
MAKLQTEAGEDHSYHKGRDCYGRPMSAGTYMMTKTGQRPVRVEVSEDEVSGDLAFVSTVEGQQVNQRVEDCAADVVFSRISGHALEAESKLESIRQVLEGAAEARNDLAAFEAELAALVGCGVGDGSFLSDAVMAAVHDGRGTPYELLETAGQLPRKQSA